jgi:hypothetical protein
MTDETQCATPSPVTQDDGSFPPAPVPVAGIGALGAGLIGGALAAVIGIAIVGPLLRRRKEKRTAKPAATRRPRRRSKPAGDA